MGKLLSLLAACHRINAVSCQKTAHLPSPIPNPVNWLKHIDNLHTHSQTPLRVKWQIESRLSALTRARGRVRYLRTCYLPDRIFSFPGCDTY